MKQDIETEWPRLKSALRERWDRLSEDDLDDIEGDREILLGMLQEYYGLSREQAVRLYTINNCFLHREEKEKGSLEAGKLADLIVIDRDVLTCPGDDIKDTKVLLTVVGGKVVFERK